MIHTYIHTYTHTYILHTYIHTYIHSYIHTYIHTFIHTYIHTYAITSTLQAACYMISGSGNKVNQANVYSLNSDKKIAILSSFVLLPVHLSPFLYYFLWSLLEPTESLQPTHEGNSPPTPLPFL